MKRNVFFVVAIGFAFILAWWLGFNLYDHPDDSSKRSASTTIVRIDPSPQTLTEEPETTPTETTPETTQDTDGQAEEVQAVIQERHIEYNRPLRYLGWEADTSGTSPKACFNFSQILKTEAEASLRDYVVVTPKVPITVTVMGSQLCAAGFGFENDYAINLRVGLPSEKEGVSLKTTQSVNISFGDKPAFVGFAGQGVILPRLNAQGLAINTVNVEELSVVVYRVTDRILSQHALDPGKSALEGEYSYDYAASNRRVEVWSGDITVETKRNETVTTVLPMAQIIKNSDPGAFIIKARDKADKKRPASAFRWIMATDMALSSYRGADGLTVSVRSIDTAKLQSGIKLALIANNNDILAELDTDAQGRARFAGPLLKGTGASTPKMVMAYGEAGDYSILNLSRPPIDLSDFDIGGRSIAGEIDVYGFAERGVYRPGEIAHLTVMLRDRRVQAVMDRPITLRVLKPNGAEIYEQRFEEAPQGGVITWDYAVPFSAPRGIWKVIIDADGIGRIGDLSFSVEDFVPQKLKLGIDVDKAPLDDGDIRDVMLDARFLYGAPGGALEGEAEARLELDPKPFEDFSDYHFGPKVDGFKERIIDMNGGITDADGKLLLGLDLKNNRVKAGYPMRVRITGGVAEPGGRYIRDSVRVPVRTEATYIGVKPDFNWGYSSSKKPVGIDLVAVDRDGLRVKRDISWRLVEEDRNWYWYRDRSRWRYRRDLRDVDVTKGDAVITAERPLRWSQKLPYGRYRLDVEAADGTTAQYRFGVGWGSGSAGSDAPDKITMGAPDRPQNPGDDFTLAINAPYAGEGDLVIANDEIRVVQSVKLAEGQSEITLPFDRDWGDSVYAMLTLYTPRDKAGQPVPRRAVGVSYVALDRTEQTLDVKIDTPDVIRPRRSQIFTIAVDNAPRGEKVWMNIAAVDEGILQLTKYKSPEVAAKFFGKKALAVTLRDDYARILNPNLGQPVTLRSGGDSLGGEGLTVVPTRTVALFSGPVSTKNGKADITFDIPDFNGELRVMATAWSKTSIGSASSAVKVRDRVPAIVGLPRFLAPGDKAFATVSLDNVEGPAGAYSAKLNADYVVRAGAATSFDLKQGQREEDKVEIEATDTGVDRLVLDVKGPNNYTVQSEFPIQVRAPYMDETVSTIHAMAPGETITLTKELIAKYFPLSTDITISTSQLAGIDPSGYIKSLRKYPYGCTEQTISTAMPLLYVEDLGGFTDMEDTARRRQIQLAVNRIVARQSLDGAFGLWRAGDKASSGWLGAYTLDFLQRAKEQGAYVPEDVFDRAYKSMRELSQMPRSSSLRYNFKFGYPSNKNKRREAYKAQTASYAYYVLAKGGQGDLSGIRYHFDNHRHKMLAPISYAYLGKALYLMGDKSRGAQAFEDGRSLELYDNKHDYYQSPLRDTAGFVALGAGHLEAEMMESLVTDMRQYIGAEKYLNTNEKSHLILALKALLENSSKPEIKAEGLTLIGDKRLSSNLLAKDLEAQPTLTNTGDKSVWVTTTLSGIPRKAPEPVANAFEISKTLYQMNGDEWDGQTIKQGEKFIVKVNFKSKVHNARMVVIADMLPAGFEIETILRPEDGLRRDGKKGPYQWLGAIASFDMTEARDDRFIASKRFFRYYNQRKTGEAAAYIVRAVTPGNFAMPAALIEDMYRPEDIARTAVSRISIVADGAL